MLSHVAKLFRVGIVLFLQEIHKLDRANRKLKEELKALQVLLCMR